MRRTTIVAEGELLDRLRAIARQEGISLAEVIRQGMELRANQDTRNPRFVGAGASTEQPFDTARRAGEIEYESGTWR
jgi:hypothetical protein